MNEQATLKAEKRDGTGKSAARRLRRQGMVPANLYGHGEESTALKVNAHDLDLLVGRISVENTLVDLRVEGGVPQKVLIREIQRHPWRSDILHVDLFHIRADEKVRVDVPIRVVGVPAGVRNAGGVLQQSRHEVEVECLPGDIPEYFELDVSALEIGDALHVADLQVGTVRPLEDPDLTLCTVLPPTVIKVEEEEEEVPELEELEPELIGREREEREEEEEGEEAE